MEGLDAIWGGKSTPLIVLLEEDMKIEKKEK